MATERTPQGEQELVPGVQPITAAERLTARWQAPIAPRRPVQQRPCNVGLFDEDARDQMDMFS